MYICMHTHIHIIYSITVSGTRLILLFFLSDPWIIISALLSNAHDDQTNNQIQKINYFASR